jgi:2,4-dienoyl-CoA reductase-like NADH-dependent reductase (Old Yellow Enzyme family)
MSTNLFSPVTIGSATAINRFAMAPMTIKQSHTDGVLSAAETDWLARRAEGGFGMVITGGWAVALEGRVWEGQVALFDERHAPPLRNLATRLADTSTLGIVQLIHGGSRHTPRLSGTEGISASRGDSWRGATTDDIDDLLSAHRAAALRVEAGCLDGVEIHAAHGFLPAQFLSTIHNRRDDAWGGDLEGRSRFLRTLVKTIRAAVSAEFIVGVRLSPEDARHGIHLSETGQVAGWLADDGADYIHLSLGDALAPSTSHPESHPVDFIRPKIPRGVPLVVAGGIWTALEAHVAAARGADIVALGHAAIYNPDWPRRAMSALWSPQEPPFTRGEFAGVEVTRPFVDYLADGWPGSVAEGSSEAVGVATGRNASHLDRIR